MPNESAAAIHDYLKAITPHVPRYVTLYSAQVRVIARGDAEVAIKYPHDVTGVEVGRQIDSWDGEDHDYLRDALTGQKVYTLRVRYADGCFADARYLDARERNELALIMRGLMEAAQAMKVPL